MVPLKVTAEPTVGWNFRKEPNAYIIIYTRVLYKVHGKHI